MAGYDLLYKLLIVGDSGTGKSALLMRFTEDLFGDSYISTIGVDFRIKTIRLDGRDIKLQVWDTAGQERFRTITSTYYRGAHGVLLVYDVTDSESFANIDHWVGELDHFASPGIVKLIVGNKVDCAPRAVSYEEGRALADGLGASFMETSAKTGQGVAMAFTILTADIQRASTIRTAQNTVTLAPGRAVKTGALACCA